jgi:hypothetical protein
MKHADMKNFHEVGSITARGAAGEGLFSTL